jgi:hypothetical protein
MNTENMNESVREQNYLAARQKVMNFLRNNIYEIVIVLVCAAFMLKGVTDIEKTGASPIEILGNAFITLLFSMSLCRLLEGKGFMSGEASTEYKRALVAYEHAAKSAGSHIKEMEAWCAKWTKQNHESVVSVKLYPFGITYKDFMNGNYDVSKYTKKELKMLESLRTYKTMELTTDQLMSGDFDSEKPIDYKKATKRNYSKKSVRNDSVSKVILSVTLGYYTLPPFDTWRWEGFAWVFLQTVLILGLSVFKYFNAYGFVTGDIRAKVIDKTNKLRQFNKEKGVESNGSIEYEYNGANGREEKEMGR